MEFVLAKERQEAERKKIEAQGIADFQAIVSKGISPELLSGRGSKRLNGWLIAPTPSWSLWAMERIRSPSF